MNVATLYPSAMALHFFETKAGKDEISENIMENSDKPIVVAIDDDPIILSSIISILSPHYEVQSFSSGSTALRFFASSHADIIILDCRMPEMDGFEVMEALMRDPITARIPILFLTAIGDGDSEVRALNAGAKDYLLKPIKPQVLLRRVRLQLELRQYRDRMTSLVEEKTNSLIKAYIRLREREGSILNMLAKATDMRDHNTGDHVWRTTEFVRLIVNELMNSPKGGYILTKNQADDIIDSSKLHDLGKIAIPDHILGKLGRLTEQEFEIIKQHPLHGANFLDEFVERKGRDGFLSTARDIALYHHEKWAGMGYPFGLVGPATPLSARIAAIADVYDALVSDRPYKSAFSHQKAFDIIASDRGRHFDPYLTECFEKCSSAFRDVPHTMKRKPPLSQFDLWANP